MNTRIKIALALIALAFLLTVSLTGSTTRAHSSVQPGAQADHEAWQVHHLGRMALARALTKQLNRGNISTKQAAEALWGSIGIDEGTLEGIARRYLKSRDYVQLVRDIEDTPNPIRNRRESRAGEVSIASVDAAECEHNAFFILLGCMANGGDPHACDEYAFRFECECQGFEYENGFCNRM